VQLRNTSCIKLDVKVCIMYFLEYEKGNFLQYCVIYFYLAVDRLTQAGEPHVVLRYPVDTRVLAHTALQLMIRVH
jgi:hypothetical protein